MTLGRPFWLAGGLLAVGVGTVGIVLPLLPTVPFYLLAAFCFARSNPVWEQKLLDHPHWGPPIRNWREKRAIPRRAKLAALTGMAASSALSLAFIKWPWGITPALACSCVAVWIWTRNE